MGEITAKRSAKMATDGDADADAEHDADEYGTARSDGGNGSLGPGESPNNDNTSSRFKTPMRTIPPSSTHSNVSALTSESTGGGTGGYGYGGRDDETSPPSPQQSRPG